jgi:hypothetical protein
MDEAHTLNTRAFGLLHLWITTIVARYKRNASAPNTISVEILCKTGYSKTYVPTFTTHYGRCGCIANALAQ